MRRRKDSLPCRPRAMAEKLAGESGLTLVEMLAGVVVLVLLGLLLNTGLQTAMSTYRSVTAKSELDLLLSTAVDAIANDVRYARDVTVTGTGITYTSDSFGPGTSLTIDDTEGSATRGQIKANGMRMLSTGAYGLDRAYKVKDMTITYAKPYFTIEMTVTTQDESISAQTPEDGVVVRCLNPG